MRATRFGNCKIGYGGLWVTMKGAPDGADGLVAITSDAMEVAAVSGALQVVNGVGDVLGIFAQLHIFDLWNLSDRPAILIGVDVLRHFQSVTLDFYRKVVVFQPAAAGDLRLRMQSRQPPGGR